MDNLFAFCCFIGWHFWETHVLGDSAAFRTCRDCGRSETYLEGLGWVRDTGKK